MGCCEGLPKNEMIEKAKNRKELISALNQLIQVNNEEINDLDSHLKKGTPVHSGNLTIFSDEDIQKRVPYLEELNASYKELISTLENCNSVKSHNNYIYIGFTT